MRCQVLIGSLSIATICARSPHRSLTESCACLFVSEVASQFLWDANARVLIDFTPGAARMVIIALAMGIKVVAVCHNKEHVRVLKEILRKYVLGEFGKAASPGLCKFAPGGLNDALEAAKPDRLKIFEMQQRKRAGPELAVPVAKRTALADEIENMFVDFDASPKPKPSAPKPKPPAPAPVVGGAPPVVPPKAGSAETPTPGASSGAAGAVPKPAAPSTASSSSLASGPEKPAEDLAALLKTWA